MLLGLCVVVALAACAGTKRLNVDASRFPIPVMQKQALNLGIHLDEALISYVHTETIEKKGTWEVSLGPAQTTLFSNLAVGVFEQHELIQSDHAAHLDAVLKPSIHEVQFSLPSQTRSDYYEVWIRYGFKLFDPQGGLVDEWKLPAYGKANKNNFGSKSVGLQEAALAACRDAMAFFSINFAKEPAIIKWLQAGQPLMPKPPPVVKTPTQTTESSADQVTQDNGGQNNTKVDPPSSEVSQAGKSKGGAP